MTYKNLDANYDCSNIPPALITSNNLILCLLRTNQILFPHPSSSLTNDKHLQMTLKKISNLHEKGTCQTKKNNIDSQEEKHWKV